MAAMDMNSLNQYIRLEDHNSFQALAEGTVAVLVTHSNLKQQWPELRFDLRMTVSSLKDRLYRHGGTGAGFQKLLLKQDGVTLCELADDARMLGFYGVRSGMEIHILDIDPHSSSRDGGLENVHLVKKYEMSEDDYEARPGTLRAYKKEMLKRDPYFTFLPENRREPKNLTPPTEADLVGIKLGDRAQVQPGDRRGEVKWLGTDAPGVGPGAWVGVVLDEPRGLGDGTVKGRVFFDCAKGHAVFARPDKVQVGDFPEVDPLADLSSDDEDEM